MKFEDAILLKMFNAYFNKGSTSQKYEVTKLSLGPDFRCIKIKLKFLVGQTYCCGELTCHFKPDWNRIREIALENGLKLKSPMEIHFDVIVENGAKLQTNDSLGLPLETQMYEYQESFIEKT